MRLLTIILLAVVIAFYSCTPKQEQQQDTPAADSATLQGTVSEAMQRLTLTPELTEKINTNLFLVLHMIQMRDEPAVLSLAEEFKASGSHFEYRLVRDNLTLAGWTDDTASDEGGESSGEESAEYAEGQGPEYAENNLTYRNQVDTIIIKGNYEAFSNDPRYILLKPNATVLHVNHPETDGPVLKSIVPYSEKLDPFLNVPVTSAVFKRNNLYLKARIALLDDSDLAGMTKDELAYFRNEIFARHGHTFKTPKMHDYFSRQEWYLPNIDDATFLLNKFEKQNTEFIKSKEGK